MSAGVQITFKVEDDFGNPVQGVAVGIATFQLWIPGKDFGEDVYKNTDLLTDTNGIAVVSGSSPRPDVSYGIHPKKHFYYTSGGEYLFQSIANNKWQPWNPTIKLILKPIVNPVPMLARRAELQADKFKPHEIGKPVGYDLMIGDWVSPYGNGETSDFLFQYDRTLTQTVTNRSITYVTGTATWKNEAQNLYDNRLSLRFSNDGDGIQRVAASSGSELRLPRVAPLDGYQELLTKRVSSELSTNTESKLGLSRHVKTDNDYDKDADYFFRVRTRKDAKGTITNALYGKIYGDFSENLGSGAIRFTYYLNPEPNSRNMEFNTRSNLFKNLKSLEQVSAP